MKTDTILNDTKLEYQNAINQGAIIDLMIEVQTVLQLLVKHNIATRQEVKETRSVVASSSKYSKMRSNVLYSINKLEEQMKFDDLLRRSVTPGEQITDDERNYLLNIFKDYKNSKED